MAELLKNLYSKEYVNNLVKEIKTVKKDFAYKSFVASVFNDTWEEKELKQRMRHITMSLNSHFSNNYAEDILLLKEVYVNILDKKNKSEALQNMIFQDYVEIYGLEYFDISMDALEHFTKSSTSEFAIRQFLVKDEDKTLKQMLLWAKSSNHEVRRLASEGCRPKLPWACFLPSFIKDPTKILEILEILQDDEEVYVQKSVANNLNDISKDHPDTLINIVKRWKNNSKSKDWILKHGSRTLLKAGNKEILNLFGFDSKKIIILSNFVCEKEVYIGNQLEFSFILETKDTLGNLRIEYSVDFVRQNNKSNNKVFYIVQKEINKKEIKINKKHSFKLINTRKYYKGYHTINIIVNGNILGTKEFKLKEIND